MALFHTFKLGEFDCTTLVDMSGEWDVWTLFPAMPRDETQALLDKLSLSPTWVRHGTVLLVDTGTQKVLIDTGLPSARGGQLITSLAAAGLTPRDIDTIFLTHGDGDHIGGLANFPDSKIIMPRESYRLWTEDENGMVEEFTKLFRGKRTAEELANMEKGRRLFPHRLPDLESRLTLADPHEQFLPGFRYIPAPGHRRDHVALEIQSGTSHLLHIADGFRHPLHCIRPDYYSLFDSYPEQLAESAKMLLAQAADSDALVFGAHLPFPALIKIGREGDHFKWIDL